MSETNENKLADFFNKNLAEPIKEKLKTIIAEFKAETVEVKAAEETAPATESYNEAPLADGTILKYTGDLAVGSKCLLVTHEGDVPAPDGEHKLADGSAIVIKKEGEDSVIAEVKEAAEMATATPAAMEAMINKIVDAKFSVIEKENKTLKAELEAAKLKLAKKSSQLADLGTVVEAMAKIGTEEPINKTVKTKPNGRISPPIEKTPL